MVKNLKTEVLIIGAGPAGLTAALYAARAGKKTLVLEGRNPSRMAIGYEIENYPGFLSINSRELLNKFLEQASHHGAEILKEDALALALEGQPKYVTTRSAFIEARAVIIATGRPFNKERMIPGEEELTGRGVSYCATCDGPLYRGREVLAYGLSEEAIDEVLELEQMGCRVKLVTGRKIKPEHEAELEKLKSRGVAVLTNYELKAITGEKRVEKVLVEKEGQPEEIAVSAVFIFREIPSTSLFTRAGLQLDQNQCLLVDRRQKTNLEGVYAAGDVTCGSLQVASAVGEGCVAAMQALAYLRK
ncbi:MAG: FAD-dependent oxidoreductase [Candidatus Saccharicenans sp.]|nr:FAD-dependent oxidoreductase [Candidatus Saccharicenans sp.]MDI6848934.1 FAD-dependent oxidoreductase [Candidatus Saccharicenans sp.]